MTRHTYDLKLEPKGFEGSIPGHFTVIVHNKGQFELPIKLFASDERERASYQLMPSVLSVPAGAKVSSHLLVVPTDLSAFLQVIEFMVQDSFGKAVKGEYSPEFEEEEEQESDSSEQEAEGDADGGREGGSGEQRGRIEQRESRSRRGRQRREAASGRGQVSRADAPTRLNVPIRPRQPRQSVSFGGRGSPISLPVDTTIRVLMGMAAFLLAFLTVTICFWFWSTPSLVMSQAPAVTQTIEATVTKVSPSIPSPTATPPPILTATPAIPTATLPIPTATPPPILTATPPIPTVTLRAGTQAPVDTPVEASLTPTDTPVEAILTPTDTPIEALPPTNIPIFASSTPTETAIEALPPTNIPIFASSTPTEIPIRAITPTETPVRVPITPATSIPIQRSQTPTPIVVPATETATLTAVPATETATLTAVPATETATLTAVPPTETATLTALPPTDTPTPTVVPRTDTPTPTVTPSLTPQLSFPDLIIRSLEVTGSPVQNNDGSFQVKIAVMIYNQGESTSDIFKVAIEASQSQGTFVVPFTVAGQSSIWYPLTSAPLTAGSRVLFEGTVTLDSSPSGEFVTLTAIADSCSGDEFMPDYCRIEESDEQNNRSAPATVRLPATSRTESIEKGE